MTSKQISQINYNSNQYYLPYFLSAFPEIEDNSIFSAVSFFVDEYLDFNKFPSLLEWPEYCFPARSMLKAFMISYALRGYSSLRDQEELYKFDLRIRCLFKGRTPCYNTIRLYQIQCLQPCMEELFIEFNTFIEASDPYLDTSALFLDGSKFEANANKMTFVWTAATRKFLTNAWKNLIGLIEKLNGWLKSNNSAYRVSILKKPEPEFLLYLDAFFVCLEDEFEVKIAVGRGHRKHPLQRLHDRFTDLAVRLFRYAVYEDLADGRNSFSKTDPDATFMHMKYDYYNHTNVFKPGYNVQIGVSSGYIRIVHVSQNCNDIHDFIPALDKYKKYYGEYPDMVPADAGYGSYDNYSYCEENNIKLMMKYSGQRKEQEEITDKNRFRSWAFQKTADGVPICPAGHEMELIRVSTCARGIYPKETSYYGCSHCKDCPLRSKCTHSKSGRKIQICHKLEKMKSAVRENMSSPEGHDLMVRRSIQAEGTFGDIKENYHFTRFKRRGLENVKFEILTVALGHNIRKLANRIQRNGEELEKYGQMRKDVS